MRWEGFLLNSTHKVLGGMDHTEKLLGGFSQVKRRWLTEGMWVKGGDWAGWGGGEGALRDAGGEPEDEGGD